MLDFMIQIIGESQSGKTKVAEVIAKALQKYGMTVKHCEHTIDGDYTNLNKKVVIISEFRAKKQELKEIDSGF